MNNSRQVVQITARVHAHAHAYQTILHGVDSYTFFTTNYRPIGFKCCLISHRTFFNLLPKFRVKTFTINEMLEERRILHQSLQIHAKIDARKHAHAPIHTTTSARTLTRTHIVICVCMCARAWSIVTLIKRQIENLVDTVLHMCRILFVRSAMQYRSLTGYIWTRVAG